MSKKYNYGKPKKKEKIPYDPFRMSKKDMELADEVNEELFGKLFRAMGIDMAIINRKDRY